MDGPLPPWPAGVQRFALADVAPEPWRNGAGLTRTVAGAWVGHCLRWRVSAADITEAGAFSVFDGVDRTAVLLDGPGLALQGPRARWVFDGVGELVRFPGEMPLHATPGGAGAARLWNVMVDRTALRAEVQVVRDRGGTLLPVSAAVLLVIEGALEVLDADRPLFTLGPDEGLLLNDLSRTLGLRSPEGPAQWVTTTFLPRS